MAKYHVGCGICDIYAGTLKSNGYEWRNKSTVTMEALGAAAQYLFYNDEEFRFSQKGKHYVMLIAEEHVAEEQDGEE